MKNFLLTFLAFISPIAPLALIVTLFVILDTLVGRWYASKTNQEITSKKTRLGFTRKIIPYFIVLICAYLIDRVIVNEIMRNYIWFDWAFTKFFASVLIWIEYTSIDEKIKWANGKGLTDRIVEFGKSLKKMVGFSKDLDPKN
jgi:phage-related holin